MTRLVGGKEQAGPTLTVWQLRITRDILTLEVPLRSRGSQPQGTSARKSHLHNMWL